MKAKINPIQLRLEKGREKADEIKVTEQTELFQHTYFTREKLKERLEYYQKKLKEEKK